VTRAIRIDQGSLRKPERTPQGFLRVDAMVARVGVLEYRNPNGSIRRELRLPEEVRSPESLAGFEGISATDGHPTVLVDAGNARALESGTVTGAARMDGDWVIAPMVIKDPKLIAKIESGKTGVSAGYEIREDHTPGVHPVYGPYDLIQRDITPNHIACAVAVPRAGSGAHIRMDGVDFLVEESRSSASGAAQIDQSVARHHGENTMDKDEQIRLLTQQLAEAQSRAESAESNLKTRTDERDTAVARAETSDGLAKEKQARLDSGAAAAEGEAVKEKQTRIDELERELSDMRKDFPVRVRDRATLVARAQVVLGDSVRCDAMDDRAIWEAGIHRYEPTTKLDKSTSDAYLKARFDSLYEGRAQSAASLKRASSDLAIRKDAAEPAFDPFDPMNNGVGPWAAPHATKKGA
jgi:hypothetical protein